ncbi:MAG: hypothetical protein ACO1TE_03020 [Prosthecobacter sp.]
MPDLSTSEITELKARAEEIRSRFDKDARRPIVIEFAGMPKAGKTTIVNEIHRFLKRCGFKAKMIGEKASICPIRDKKDSSFNIWTVCQTLSELLVDTQSPPNSGDPEIVLLDRGIFDAVAWLRLLERLKRLKPQDRESVENFVLLEDWRNRISKVILLTVDPAQALEREEGLLPISVAGSIMNLEVLGQTRENVLKCTSDFEEYFDIEHIDTTNKKTAVIALKVAQLVLDIIEAQLNERILSIERDAVEQIFGHRTILNPEDGEKVLDLFGTTGVYESRSIVEDDKSRIQALPVLVVRDAKGRVLQLRRRERDRKNPLNNRLVVWAGGHVREEDGLNGKALMRGLLREAKEELKLNIQEGEVSFLGIIWERHSSLKTSQHIALVYEWRAQTEDVEVCLSNAEFFERRGTSLSGKFVSASSLIGSKELEQWSALIVSEFLVGVDADVQRQLI